MKRVIALIGLFVLSLPTLLMAQDGTYIDNLGAQDSSYMDEDLLAGVEQSSGSNTTVIVIVVAVIVIAAGVFFFLKKKKK
jgi:LPXTG-motif cell wall-anchored protein